FLMNHFFWGFFLSVLFGIASSVGIYLIEPIEIFKRYHEAFFLDFNCAISGGLIIGAALLIYKTQNIIPDLIEEVFTKEDLDSTDYKQQKNVYYSRYNSIIFSTEFIIIGFIIFYFAKFPLNGITEYLMIIFGCIQYGLGVYVGRKLFYIAQMLNSIENIDIKKNIFSDDKLGGIATYVNAISTITIIFVYVHVNSYYNAPFVYDTIVVSSIKIALLIPAIIATPVVLLFNFYPRTVLRKLYNRSISIEVKKLTTNLKKEHLSYFERKSYMIQYDNLSKDELRYRLRLTLSDLPIGITIIIMIIQLL
ncbi:MAG: hypothetical protein OQL19_16400, partial [Gammaproteobacteria bacterium]|nr:hypothetical protein [Gammaproteobacteria bacterium]